MKATGIGFWSIVAMIFFTVSGGPFAVEDVLRPGPGLGILLLIVTPLFWSVPIALVSAELGSSLPDEEGGYYSWTKRALGPFPAFCQGWWAWLRTFIDLVFYPAMACDYLANFGVPVGPGNPIARKGLMIGTIWILILLNLRGITFIGMITRYFLLLVLLPFVIMVAVGIYTFVTAGQVNPQAFLLIDPDVKPLGAVFATAVSVAMWNFGGWDLISPIVRDMKNPQRHYPRALAVAVVLIIATYLLPSLIGVMKVGTFDGNWTAGAWGGVAAEIGGAWLQRFVSAMGIVSAIGLYSAFVLVLSRVPFAMARDGYLPSALMRRNSRGAPWVSLVCSGIVHSLVTLVLSDIDKLAVIEVTFYSSVVALEFLAFIALRLRSPDLPRAFRVPCGWWGVVGLCLVAFAFATLRFSMMLYYANTEKLLGCGLSLAFLASGPLLYPLARRWCRAGPEQK